jgi:hypothetical protein
MYASREMPIPIRTALGALLLTFALLVLEPHRPASASPGHQSSTAALVVPAPPGGPTSEPRFSPLGLAAMVAFGWLPAVVLLTRKRRRRTAAT